MTKFTRLAAASIATLLTATAAAQAPDVIRVPGTVRDFQTSHPDFNVTPVGGPGHYAGNVGVTIGANQRPVFAGPGFKVAALSQLARLIANGPHLHTNDGVRGLVVLSRELPGQSRHWLIREITRAGEVLRLRAPGLPDSLPA